MDDTISRKAAIDAIANRTNCVDEKTLRAYVAKNNLDNEWTGGVLEAIDAVEDLPSAQPQIIRCKDCKHWKDSDGVYRRGSDAESKCPINLKEVYEGTFYCGKAEKVFSE